MVVHLLPPENKKRSDYVFADPVIQSAIILIEYQKI